MQPNEQQLRQQLHGKILGKLETPSTQSGMPNMPKDEKILEWTLFKIYEQMQEMNRNITSLVTSLNRRPTS